MLVLHLFAGSRPGSAPLVLLPAPGPLCISSVCSGSGPADQESCCFGLWASCSCTCEGPPGLCADGDATNAAPLEALALLGGVCVAASESPRANTALPEPEPWCLCWTAGLSSRPGQQVSGGPSGACRGRRDATVLHVLQAGGCCSSLTCCLGDIPEGYRGDGAPTLPSQHHQGWGQVWSGGMQNMRYKHETTGASQSIRKSSRKFGFSAAVGR